MPAARFSLYLFDLDGTLVDSREDLAHAVNHAREGLGLGSLSLATVSGYVGEGLAKLMERALGAEHADLLEEATRRFRTYYAAHLLAHTRAYEGIEALLRELVTGGARLAVATNKPEAYSRAILAGLGLARYFEALVGGDTLAERKPHPLPLLHLMGRFSASPAQTLMVGDSAIDVLAARAAGVPICAVTYGIGPRDELRALAPDFLADHPEEVLAAVPSA